MNENLWITYTNAMNVIDLEPAYEQLKKKADMTLAPKS
jgi:hypothetical protein